MLVRTPRLHLLLLIVLLGATTALPGLARAEEDDLLASATIDVSDLLTRRHATRAPTLVLRASNFDLPGREAWEPQPFLASPDLQAVIRHMVAPKSWEEVPGADLDIHAKRLLIVRNRPEAIRQVRALVERLRAQAAAGYTLEVDVTEGAATNYPAEAPEARLGQSTSMELVPRLPSSAEVLERTRYIQDYEVEIAQGSNIANPVPYEALGGLVAEIMATPTVLGDRVVLSGIIQQAHVGTIRRVETGIDEEYLAEPPRSDERLRNGVVELPTYATSAVVFQTVVAPGSTFRMPVAHAGRQQTFRVRVARRAARAPAGARSAGVLRFGSLAGRSLGASYGWTRLSSGWVDTLRDGPLLRFSKDAGDGVDLFADDVLDRLRELPWVQRELEAGHVELNLYRTGALVDKASEPLFQRMRAYLAGEEQRTLRGAEVGVRVLSVAPNTVRAGPGAAVLGGDATLLAGGRVPTLHGRRSALIAGETQAFLGDYDVEVAQEARIADPIVGTTYDGLAVNVRPLYPEGSNDALLSVQLRFSMRTVEPGGYASKTRYLGPIDLVKATTRDFNTSVRVTRGGTYVIDAGADPRTPGRRIVIELSVSAP